MDTLEVANTALAREFIVMMSRDPAAAVDEFLHESGNYWVSGQLPISGDHDKPTILELVRPLLGAFASGPHLTVVSTTAQGDRVAVEVEGVGELLDGRAYRPTYHFLLLVRDGRFDSIKEYADTHQAHELFFAGQGS